jgi:tRNA pseudouridine32 synthase/23S rRNA pseudouridine746 synthase
MPPILYEDDDIIAVDKPAGIASIPERRGRADCLLYQLRGNYPFKIFVVHRLDKEVSGVILFAKNPEAHRHLNKQFNQHLVNKTYKALVHGRMPVGSGEICEPIRAYGSGRMGVDRERGKECLTRYHIQEQYPDHSLVTVSPLTGRRHQIRVHFFSIGHPVAGDPLYGDKNVQGAFPRLMLHAHKIDFKTKSGTIMQIKSPVPELFLSVLETVR